MVDWLLFTCGRQRERITVTELESALLDFLSTLLTLNSASFAFQDKSKVDKR